MPSLFLSVDHDAHAAIWDHLLASEQESAGFLFVSPEEHGETVFFQYMDWFPVPPEGFSERSKYHFELTDAIRSKIIKQAHDTGASLVEFHSHAGGHPAAFSWSDHLGFREFVPHVWWRLKGRPYLAIVVSRLGFDGLVWTSSPRVPKRLDGMFVDGTLMAPTHLSALDRDSDLQ